MTVRYITTRCGRQTAGLGKKIGKLIRTAAGRNIGPGLGKGMHIALEGDLGAGKTTFVQGLARGLGVPEQTYVTSPTFTIINEYPMDDLMLCHIDLYRLGSVDELEFTGFSDLLDQGSILVIEWPRMLMESGFFFDLVLEFRLSDDFSRKISFSSYGQAASNLLQKLFS